MLKQESLVFQALQVTKVLCVVLVVLAAGTGAAIDGYADDAGQHSTGWMTNFNEAEAVAKKAGVPLVVHFWAPWCGPCRNMETEVLSSQNVRALLGNGIIGVKVNSDENRSLVSRFGITALPADVFVSPDGKVLSRSVGSPGLQGYLARLGQFRETRTAPVLPDRSIEQAVAKTEEPKVKTVTAAKPVINEVTDTEKPIVGLNTATEEPKVASVAPARAEPSVDTAAAPSSPPVAQKKALRKSDGHRLGLSGYSPVLLTDATKWQKGDPQFSHNFQGVHYQLTSAEELERFKASPEKFIPVLHGCDPVSLVKDQTVISGFVEIGASFRSRMYFFTTKASRDEFLKSPEKFVSTYNLAFFESVEPAAAEPSASATDEAGSAEQTPAGNENTLPAGG
ncbi:MAG: thioredoxin domain-containing protein [Planctomyces sp.]|jgi:thiol-disulfide isomerase/thioredoxin/YHS domain-containing protein